MSRAPGERRDLRKYSDDFDHERHIAFLRQRCQAKYRNELWTLTIEEFFQLWTPELWGKRGRSPQSFCMTRLDNSQAWSRDNVAIVMRHRQLRERRHWRRRV